MQLTSYTDYSLRMLIYLGINLDRLVTIAEVAQVYGISRNHLMKVAHNLAIYGYVRSVPGKKGGITLKGAPESINLGDVVRTMESNFAVVECFNGNKNTCCIRPACLLQGVFRKAVEQFMSCLDEYTLADILKNQDKLIELTIPRAPRPAPDLPVVVLSDTDSCG